MSKTGALDLVAGVGGTIEKSQVLSAVDKYIGKCMLLPFTTLRVDIN